MPAPSTTFERSPDRLDREIAYTETEAHILEEKLAACHRHLAELRLTKAERTT